MSEEQKQKLSLAFKGRKRNPFSEDHKRKMSESLKRNPKGNYGKPMSEEQKQKISKALLGKAKPNRTQEHKDNISKAITKRWAEKANENKIHTTA